MNAYHLQKEASQAPVVPEKRPTLCAEVKHVVCSKYFLINVRRGSWSIPRRPLLFTTNGCVLLMTRF